MHSTSTLHVRVTSTVELYPVRDTSFDASMNLATPAGAVAWQRAAVARAAAAGACGGGVRQLHRTPWPRVARSGRHADDGGPREG